MTAPSVAQLFTAAEYANVLRCSPRYVRKLLKDTPVAGKKLPRSQSKLADAWEIGSLPSALIEKLSKMAKKLGYSSPLGLMQNPLSPDGVKSLASVAHAEIERAQKLQRAFAACLAMPAETSTRERARIAAPHYAREFVKLVNDRHLRRVIDRILKADAGRRNFADLTIYLAKERARKRIKRSPLSGRFDFRELDDHFEAISKRSNPTLKDIAFCWRKIVAFYKDRIAAGADAVSLKNQLLRYVFDTLPFISDSPDAIKRSFNLKLRDEAELGDEAFIDGRAEPEKSNAFLRLKADFEPDLKLLAKHALFYCGKRISQAYRLLQTGTTHNRERFSEAFRDAFPFNCRKAKSRVPGIVRRAVAPMVRAAAPLRLGPRAAKLALPSIRRDWTGVRSGDRYTADDETGDEPVINWCEGGEWEYGGRRFNVLRPQLLPVADDRSDLILGFCLIPHKNYTSRHIKALIAQICMRPEIGLPFKGFLFERGIWNARNVNALVSWSEIDESFARNGIRLGPRAVKHATTPKAKIIERVIGATQNLREFSPGYVGHDERKMKYERIQSFLRSLKRVDQPLKAEVDPSQLLMNMEEFADHVAEAFRRFADEPQNGERLPGISPNEGWKEFSGGRVHRVLPESLRFLLATDESIRTVNGEGIDLRIGRCKHKYFGSERLGELIGEKVRVRYNPELPEMISVAHIVSDPHGINPFSVPLFERVPAHGATREEFARAREHQNAFARYGRAIYRELVPKFNRTLCDSRIGSAELRAAGEAQNQLEREHIDLGTRRDANGSAIRKSAARLNLGIDPQRVKDPERVRKHLEEAERLRAEILESERIEEAAT